MTQNMSKNPMRLNYKQYHQCLRNTGDMVLQNVTVEEKCPTVFWESPIDRYIIIAVNNCGYIRKA